MRIPIIAGNWKMNTTLFEAMNLAEALKEGLDPIAGVDKVLCPPFTSLAAVREVIAGTTLELGAQNMHFEAKGAFTGEISPVMLAELCQFVILGHSERRGYFGETDELVGKKVKAAQSFGLTPILCVGESLEDREGGRTEEVVVRQLKGALSDIASPKGLVIAYEPIWAIGTGRAASGEDANAVIGLIRRTLAEIWGQEEAQTTRIQYGGSVTAANVAEFLAQPEIDGALVGGASLKAGEFVSIVEQTARLKGSG